MNLVKIANLDRPSIYIPPKNFSDYLLHEKDYFLFIDIDGTLADFTLHPKDSVIPASTLTLLDELQRHGVKIAVVTGRSLVEARKMLSPVKVPIAATHGLEIAFDDDDNNNANSVAVDTTELNVIKQTITQSCRLYKNFLIENKPYSVALHFRQNPALAKVAYTIMTEALDSRSDWALKAGKYVWEIAPKEANKGYAILTLLKKMSADHNFFPIFIGDDITDEAGFVAVQGENTPIKSNNYLIKGMGIKVGKGPTCAHYHVNSTHEVTVLLDSFLGFYQKQREAEHASLNSLI